jgi:hypothetical protein
MFLKPHRDSESAWIQTVRDIVEIVAITLAGAWAIYIFVYENRIRPTFAPPNLVFSAEMERVGTHRDLAVVKVITHVKNVGTAPAQFLGYSETVTGSRVLPVGTTPPPRPNPSVQVYRPFYSFTKPVVVYRRAFLTHATNPSITADLRLEPSETVDENTIVYAPLKAFDHLSLTIVAGYVREATRPIPTTLSYAPDGIPRFSVDTSAVGVQELYGVNTEVAALDISAR